MNKWSMFAASGLTVALAATIAGCSGPEAKKPETQSQATQSQVQSQASDTKDAEKTLKGWEGTWNNFVSYLDDKELDSAYAEKAKKAGKAPEDIKNELKKLCAAEFAGLEIKGDTISFLDGFKDKGGKETTKATYKFAKSYKAEHGGKELEWDAFEAQEKDAKYPVLLLMPVHGEEGLLHFHMRFGTNADELLKNDGWFPTFVKPESTVDQIADEIKE